MCDFSETLLDWYDVHARKMPWRVSPADKEAGQRPDPYHVWLSEIMLQQTTVAAVTGYFEKFVRQWPSIRDLASAKDADVMAAWAGLGYYARARNLLKCARAVVSEYDGKFPSDHSALLSLPGIGPYTAGAVASIAFDQPHVVVDGNVERVVSRLFDEHTPLPEAKPLLTKLAKDLTPAKRPGDYAQAVMDLGATICTPKSPTCGICPLREPCLSRVAGTAEELPKKAPKKPKPVRHGYVYVAHRPDGAWLLETRPEKGLLGGMLGWPGSDWVDVSAPVPSSEAPLPGEWQRVDGEVRHTFTHFHLVLQVFRLEASIDANPLRGRFYTKDTFKPSDLPTLMRKAFDLSRNV